MVICPSRAHYVNLLRSPFLSRPSHQKNSQGSKSDETALKFQLNNQSIILTDRQMRFPALPHEQPSKDLPQTCTQTLPNLDAVCNSSQLNSCTDNIGGFTFDRVPTSLHRLYCECQPNLYHQTPKTPSSSPKPAFSQK